MAVLALVGMDMGAARAAGGPGPTGGVTCDACIVVDGEGRTLWSRSPHASLPNASTTKMVTALLVVKEAELDEQVVVSDAAAATGGGGLDLLPGDTYTVEALLYALMLSSSNDAAVALAEHVSGSEAVFVDAMNRWLERFGSGDTTFVTPHGLDASGHAASPADLAAIGMEVLDHPVLGEIVASREKTISGSGGSRVLTNSNLLLESYRGAVGVKTGMTLGAGEVLVAAARRRGYLVVAVSMRSFDAAADATKLLDLGFDRLADEVVLRAHTTITEAVLDPGGTVDLLLSRDIRVLPPAGTVRRAIRLDPSFDSSLSQGERVGTIELVVKGKVVASSPLEAAEPVPSPEESMIKSLLAALLALVYAAGRAVGVA